MSHVRRACVAFAVTALAVACLAVAAQPARALSYPNSEAGAEDRLFPRPDVVARQVRFWERVFYQFPSTTAILHDPDDADRVLDIIDFKMFAARDGERTPNRKDREGVVQRYIERYTQALERFAKSGEEAVKYGAIERRVHRVYRDSPAALKRLLPGNVHLRAQTGLADDFVAAAGIARGLLPYMEAVFRQSGLPVRLTRLAFVESMFNVKAVSKVGAVGIWQFMPDTARSFIHVNTLVDERQSPYKATRAAAQLLAANYDDLKSWPLAVTAYNHGRIGLTRAAKLVGTKDIGTIIERYESASFGFASRNFYAEFLAAARTYDRLLREGRVPEPTLQPETEFVSLPQPTSVAALVRHTPLSADVLQELNPCLRDTTFSRNADRALPQFYQLRVPRSLAGPLKLSLKGLRETRYATR
jgi:membrane-bound lytic murein transglycosylase D